MTDKQQLINLLTKAKANFKEETLLDTVCNIPIKSTIEINNSNKYTSNVPGYYDFISIWYFDEEDNLVMIGNWE